MKRILLFAFLCLGAVLTGGETLKLENSWEFLPAVKSTPLPGADAEWKPRKEGNPHSVWQRMNFRIPEKFAGQRFFLFFNQINGDAIVFVNGKKAGERLGPFGEIEITSQARVGKNELLVFVTRDYTDISRGEKEDLLRSFIGGSLADRHRRIPLEKVPLGISEPVDLLIRPVPSAFTDCEVRTSVSGKKIEFRLEIETLDPVAKPLVSIRIFDQDNNVALQFDSTLPELKKGTNRAVLSRSWKNPHLWELDAPYLYRAEVTLHDSAEGGRILDSFTLPFGFREISTAGRSLLLNGHPMRWRVEWYNLGISPNSVTLLKLLGRNLIYAQPHSELWFREWFSAPYYSQEFLDLLDRNGIGLLMPVPSVNYLPELNEKPELLNAYRTETEAFMRRYRNHPCLIGWSVAMNNFCPTEVMTPAGIGVRKAYQEPAARVIQTAFDVVHEIDPTRIVYGHHAGGNSGDIATANIYPNLMPLQEVADWPELWAQQGNMPMFASEYAAVYDGTYFKGKSFLMTEYGAMLFGEKAYDMETEKQLEETLRLSAEADYHGTILSRSLSFLPMYWEIQKRYIEATDRAWRSWGVSGWHYFNLFVAYGEYPGGRKPYVWKEYYAGMPEPLTQRPDWANPLFDAHAKYMQTLLVYLGGSPVHTDRTHIYTSGETVEKCIATVWDGGGETTVAASWKLLDASGKTILSGKRDVVLKPGEIRNVPFSFRAPDVPERSEFQLELSGIGNGREFRDVLALTVFPAKKVTASTAKVRLFDPKNLSGYIRELVPDTVAFKAGEKLLPGEVLIIGREALTGLQQFPFSAADLEAGARVVILEQRPEVWEAMGFRVIDVGARQVWAGTAPGMLLNGLNESDLAYWRGKSTLLPEFQYARRYDITPAPRSSNRHTVASTLPEIPEGSGFIPLLVSEFDLNYSPLMRWNIGSGMLLICSLDFTGRAGNDPAATRLAANLIDYAASAKCSPGKAVIHSLAADTDPAATILVTSEGKNPEIDRYLSAGGTVLRMNLSAETLETLGVKSSSAQIRRVSAPHGELKAGPQGEKGDPGEKVSAPHGELKDAVSRNLLRWRDALEVNRIIGGEGEIDCDGIFLIRNVGKGREIFCQVSSELLDKRYQNDPDRREGIALSIQRLRQLPGRILTHFGAASSPEARKRLLTLLMAPAFQELGFWNVLGPYRAAATVTDPASILDTVFPGEGQALKGDLNPNFSFPGADGRQVDFRPTVSADAKGFVNLGQTLKAFGNNEVAYAVKIIHADKPRKAMLRIGADYFFRLYVNGEPVYEQSEGHGAVAPNRFRIMIDLVEGDNVITMKILSGTQGFGFFAELSEPGEVGRDRQIGARDPLYDNQLKIRTPYEFIFW